MPIHRLLQNTTFTSDQVAAVTAAYEDALISLNLVDRTDKLTEIIARKIIECAQAGEFDRTRLRDCALKALMKN
jgi:hypothetical protein